VRKYSAELFEGGREAVEGENGRGGSSKRMKKEGEKRGEPKEEKEGVFLKKH